jgi:hypothetical protein
MFSAQSAFATLAEVRPSKLRIDFRNIRLFTVEAAKEEPNFSVNLWEEGAFSAAPGQAAKKLAQCTESAPAVQS